MVKVGKSWCRMVQTGTEWCKLVQDDADWCRMVQDCEGWSKLVQDGASRVNVWTVRQKSGGCREVVVVEVRLYT